MAEQGRNDPCPCGSGKKYKKCCLVKDEADARAARATAEAERQEAADEQEPAAEDTPEPESKPTPKPHLHADRRGGRWGKDDRSGNAGGVGRGRGSGHR